MTWRRDDGLIDVTSAFRGLTAPIAELIDDIHRRGWTVSKVDIHEHEYRATAKSPHGETLEARGRTDATAVGNLLVRVMRREHMRSSAVKTKLGAWDHYPIEQQFAQIAQAYAGAPVYEPKAAPAWMELAQDAGRRAQIIRTQLAVEYTDDPVPYETANDLREDVTQKRHVLVSRAYAHHPVWSEQQMLDYRLLVDVLGHAIGGGDWGWHGSCMAFASLAPLLADVPQKALFTELLGQAAFGAFYRQWGPQKVCFLEKELEKLQEKENKPGHTGVHPSQSIAPGAIPSIFSRTAMAERSGNPQLDALIEQFMRDESDYIGMYRNAEDAANQCADVTDYFVRWLQEHGVHAFPAQDPSTDFVEENPQWAPDERAADPDTFGYADRSVGGAPVHDAAMVPMTDGVYMVDWTASQYGYSEFPMVQRLGQGDQWQRQWTSATTPTDPNANWESGVNPLPDSAYLWQRQDGVDPLRSSELMEHVRGLDTGVSRMHPQMAQQAVVNALRSSLLGSRTNPMAHAVHYQDLANVPAEVDDPIAYYDALEQQREAWNQAKGYAPGSHKQYWPEEQKLKQWVKAANPELDDGDVHRVAKRELLHMLTEEEERILATDQGEQLPAEVIEHEAYEAIKQRLKALTKPNVDQKVDFGEDHLWHEASQPGLAYHVAPTSVRDAILANGLDPQYNDDAMDKLEGRPQAVYLHRSLTDANMHRAYKPMPSDIWEVQMGDDLRPDPYNHAPSDESNPHVVSTFPIAPDRIRFHSSHTATHHADMYPPFLASRMRSIAHVSRYAKALAEAAREDLVSHKGHGHHFRAQALNLGIPGLGPRQASHAWLHLAPQTSQLAIINPEVAETLGHDYATDTTNRDYFKHERELAAGRDASGYGHVPLGAFSTGVHDLYAHGPGVHPDRSAFKVHAPTPHHAVNWLEQQPSFPGWTDPYWWASTGEARDGAAQDFDRTVGVNFPRDQVPFQKTAARSYYRWLPASIRDQVTQNGMVPNPDTGNPMHFWDNLENAQRYGEISNSVEPHDLWEVQGRPGRLKQDPWFKMMAPGTYPEYGDRPGAWQGDADHIPPERLRRLGADASGAAFSTEIPLPGRSPWVMHPGTGQRLTGAPGTSLMQHVKDSLGHPDAQSVWAQDLQVGKDSPGTIAKVAAGTDPEAWRPEGWNYNLRFHVEVNGEPETGIEHDSIEDAQNEAYEVQFSIPEGAQIEIVGDNGYRRAFP